METWYSKNLGDGIDAYAPTQQIINAFNSLIDNGLYTKAMAVFSSYDTKANIKTVYFTPEAEILAKVVEAKPCNKPTSSSTISLLVGDESILKKLFP